VFGLQFAFTIGFHILWPAYTIGVSEFIVILKGAGGVDRRSREQPPAFSLKILLALGQISESGACQAD
jgi:cytochrome bd-type quinol oxidase subunit 1